MILETVINANVYMGEGTDLLGKVKKFTIPPITHKFEELAVLGSFGANKVWVGIDDLKADLEWSSFHVDAFPERFNPFETTELQLRGNVQSVDAGTVTDTQPVVVVIEGRFDSIKPGEIEARSPLGGMSDSIMVEKMTITVGGTQYLKIDISNQIYTVNGVDLLAKYKANGAT